MNTDIANIVLEKISALNWVDKYAGLVRPIVMTQPNGAGVIKKTFPVSCSVSEQDCVSNNLYTDLVPNSKYNSVMYFEDGGVSVLGGDTRYIECRSTLSLIGWLNGKKLGHDGCGLSAICVLTILKALRPYFSPFNSGSYTGIKINAVSEDPKNPNIFTRYSYDESTNQFLMYPYDYFRLNLQITYKIAVNCIDDLTILNPSC